MTYLNDLSEGFKDIFLAGVGAMALTTERTKDLIEQLIAKGELTVDQGKEINFELKHRVDEATSSVRYDLLEARMEAMSAKERNEFAEKVAEFAQAANAKAASAAVETISQSHDCHNASTTTDQQGADA